jgi:hypothetical protein
LLGCGRLIKAENPQQPGQTPGHPKEQDEYFSTCELGWRYFFQNYEFVRKMKKSLGPDALQ